MDIIKRWSKRAHFDLTKFKINRRIFRSQRVYRRKKRKWRILNNLFHLIPPFENNIRQRGTSIIVINAEGSARNASQAFNQIT